MSGSGPKRYRQAIPGASAMDKTTLGVLGAISALVAFDAAGAAPLTAANSFAELLDPIPNAVARLKADDVARKAQPQPTETIEDGDCRPMSRAGCFRPRKPDRPAPVTVTTSPIKPAPPVAAPASN
jgi:hypothetical protein